MIVHLTWAAHLCLFVLGNKPISAPSEWLEPPPLPEPEVNQSIGISPGSAISPDDESSFPPAKVNESTGAEEISTEHGEEISTEHGEENSTEHGEEILNTSGPPNPAMDENPNEQNTEAHTLKYTSVFDTEPPEPSIPETVWNASWSVASPEVYPFVAIFQIMDTSCCATVLNSHWLLTAAWCIDQLPSSEVGVKTTFI